jgi:hypothetical protein
MNHSAVRPVPPGSSGIRELLLAITDTLALPKPATLADETTYLRLHRDRARLVLFACRRILADREADDDDLIIAADSLRNYAGDHPDDTYEHAAGHAVELTP